MIWHTIGPIDLGAIPDFLHDDDPRPARDQFDERYVWGGWRPQEGFTWVSPAPLGLTIQYPGDEPLSPLAYTHLRNEVIVLYRHSFVAIFQRDGSFEVSRLD